MLFLHKKCRRNPKEIQWYCGCFSITKDTEVTILFPPKKNTCRTHCFEKEKRSIKRGEPAKSNTKKTTQEETRAFQWTESSKEPVQEKFGEKKKKRKEMKN